MLRRLLRLEQERAQKVAEEKAAAGWLEAESEDEQERKQKEAVEAVAKRAGPTERGRQRKAPAQKDTTLAPKRGRAAAKKQSFEAVGS